MNRSNEDFQSVASALTAMRADDDSIDEYANRYLIETEMRGTEPDFGLFYNLWDRRYNSDEDMAELLAEVMQVDYEEALSWVTDVY